MLTEISRNRVSNFILRGGNFTQAIQFTDQSQTEKSWLCIEREIDGLHSEKEKVLSEHRDIRNFQEMRADQAVRGERVAQTKLSEAAYHMERLLEEQKDYSLSEARSELDAQELRVECADRALRESGMQLHSQRKENFTRRIIFLSIPKRKELVMYRIGQKRKSSSRRSCEECSKK